MNKQCYECLNLGEDLETGENYCTMYMDQDDMERSMYNRQKGCPYFRPGDDYTIVKKQAIK